MRLQVQQGWTRLGAGLVLVAVLAGCSDRRLKNLTKGMDRPAAMAAMGVRPGPDTLSQYRAYPYLTDGHIYEVLFFYPRGKGPADSLPDKKLSPLVFVDNRLVAWGQADYVPLAKRVHLPLGPNTPAQAPRPAEPPRVDSAMQTPVDSAAEAPKAISQN